MPGHNGGDVQERTEEHLEDVHGRKEDLRDDMHDMKDTR
jgi:hypothetical protein